MKGFMEELRNLFYNFALRKCDFRGRWSANLNENSKADSPEMWDGSLAVGSYIPLTYLFKNGLASQVIVFRLHSCLFLPRTAKYSTTRWLIELVATFIDSECYRPKGISTREMGVVPACMVLMMKWGPRNITGWPGVSIM